MIPPITKQVLVPTTPARAFEIFWSDIAIWWPLHTHSVSGMTGKTARGVRFEPKLGGKIVELTEDGASEPWGTITEWRPGAVMAFTWHVMRPESEATEVRVTFAASEAGTRVELTHSGWDARGAEGAEGRESYDKGWESVFVRAFAQAAGVAA